MLNFFSKGALKNIYNLHKLFFIDKNFGESNVLINKLISIEMWDKVWAIDDSFSSKII